MSDDFVGWANSDEWHVVSDGSVAMIANTEIVHPRDVSESLSEWDLGCGDCYLRRTWRCHECFWLPRLLLHDTFCGVIE